MNEMIDRIARSMRDEALDPSQDGYFTLLARSAIEAMREPTAAMTDAAFENSLCAGSEMNQDFPLINTRIYRAMIDAALSPSERS